MTELKLMTSRFNCLFTIRLYFAFFFMFEQLMCQCGLLDERMPKSKEGDIFDSNNAYK